MTMEEECRLDRALEVLAMRRAWKIHPNDEYAAMCASVSYYRRLLREYLS